jgi:hypothetical protein
MRRTGAAALVLLAVTSAAGAQPGFAPVEITAYPINSFTIANPESGYGTIEFRGGLSLASRNRDFGGFSGLEILPDGRLLAVADTGFWLMAELVEENGWLVGVTAGQIAPILDADGEEANRKSSADAEGLRLTADGNSVIVSFEQDHRLSRYSLADLPLSRPVPIELPRLTGLGGNRGIEAVAIAPVESPLAGAIVIISEEASDGAGGIRGWVVDGPKAGQFSVRRIGQFSITDAAFLPNGDLLILERLFSLSQGIAMRIRRLSADDIRPGATVDGPVILYDDNLFQIDNMEGMALRPQDSGDVIITLISDDNQSLLQRTLLLQFVWREAAAPLPRARP